MWARKKKNTGTLIGRFNVRGFKLIDGQHCDELSVYTSVMVSAFIRITSIILLVDNMKTEVMETQGTFLKRDVEDKNRDKNENGSLMGAPL